MNLRFRSITLALVGLAMFLPSCASTNQDEAESDRRIRTLEEDNEALRKRLADQGAVESALERELKARSQDAGSSRQDLDRVTAENRRLTEDNSTLRGQVATLEAQLRERPASLTEEKKESGIASGGFAGSGVAVEETGDGRLRLSIEGSVLFATASADLTPAGKKTLDRIGDELRRQSDVFVSVEGHTDAMPLGKSKDRWGTNMALSMARALVVHDYLKTEEKVPERRMRVVGYGEHRPVASGKSAAAYAKNRRVELLLSRGDS